MIPKRKFVVRLSSSCTSVAVLGNAQERPSTPQEWQEERRKLISLLEQGGFAIRNGSGDQIIGLHTIQERSIKVSDAFVFLPDPTLGEVFKFISLIVGYQTDDPALKGKPTIVVNLDHSWQLIFDALERLHHQGMMLSPYTLITVVDSIEEVIPQIQKQLGMPEPNYMGLIHEAALHQLLIGNGHRPLRREAALQKPGAPDFNVCVFCSASTTNVQLKKIAYNLGCLLAKQGKGVVFGAGKTGMMGEVFKGALAHGGHVRGANVRHIADIEGVPEGLDHYWGEEEGIDDIYKRVEVMVDNSDAFIILPGGAGTWQELLALVLLMRAEDNSLMRSRRAADHLKDILIVNTPVDGGDGGFYDLSTELLQRFGYELGQDFHVVADEEEATQKLAYLHAPLYVGVAEARSGDGD